MAVGIIGDLEIVQIDDADGADGSRWSRIGDSTQPIAHETILHSRASLAGFGYVNANRKSL